MIKHYVLLIAIFFASYSCSTFKSKKSVASIPEGEEVYFDVSQGLDNSIPESCVIKIQKNRDKVTRKCHIEVSKKVTGSLPLELAYGAFYFGCPRIKLGDSVDSLDGMSGLREKEINLIKVEIIPKKFNAKCSYGIKFGGKDISGTIKVYITRLLNFEVST